MCRYSLRLFNKYKSIESKSRTFYEQKGDLPSDLETGLLEAYEDFKTFRVTMTGFAEILNYTLPKYENAEPQFIVDDKKVIFTSKIEIEADIYQDEEERDFYEKFPESIMNSTADTFDLPEEWKSSEEIEEIYKDEIDPDAIGKQSIKERYIYIVLTWLFIIN